MIVKQRSIPLSIQVLEALLRRIPENHSKREKLKEELSKRRAGFKGEQQLDYFLSFLDRKKYSVFHGLRLSSGDYFFQMDTLLLTPQLAIILEVKNYAGTIYFDPDFNQLIRINNEKEEGFQNPLSQARHQAFQLKKWLSNQGFSTIPVEYAVVFSNPSTIIKTAPGHAKILYKVFHAHHLLTKIDSIEKIHKPPSLTTKEMKKIGRALLRNHESIKLENLLNIYEIESKEIRTGVQCPKCNAIPMNYDWGKWHCLLCSTSSLTAHRQTIEDYFILINPTITNSEFRKFAHIQSVYTGARLLSSMNLPFTGDKRNRVYRKA